MEEFDRRNPWQFGLGINQTIVPEMASDRMDAAPTAELCTG